VKQRKNQIQTIKKEEQSPWKKAILFFFFPPQCALCKTVGYEDLCPRCREELDFAFDPRVLHPRGGSGFADEMLSLFPYDALSVKRLLLDWKKEDFEDLHHIFRSYMDSLVQKDFFPKDVDCIAYCPRRKGAARKAGFDQAAAIAAELADCLSLPLRPLLKRRGFSRPQHKVRGKKREENVRGVFEATQTLQGENVLLVDDIITTGASCREAARILKQAGAMKVYVFSLAHHT